MTLPEHISAEVFAGLTEPAPVDAPANPGDVSRRLWLRFWSKVDRTAGCWVWTAADRVGYGAIKIDGKVKAAHRLSWIWHNGPVPAGKVLDHLCGNRACVRPDHLEPVTHRENVLRGVEPHFAEVAS